MKLKFSGHERFPTPTKVSAEELKKKCSEKNGCFEWKDSEWKIEDDVLIVRFGTNVFILDKLTENERKDVLAHEKRHWENFQRHVLELKAALEKIIKAGRDPEPEMDARWEWMKYDICRADAAFHREVERFPIPVCLEPSSTRPK
jgi:hypothetical protein